MSEVEDPICTSCGKSLYSTPCNWDERDEDE